MSNYEKWIKYINEDNENKSSDESSLDNDSEDNIKYNNEESSEEKCDNNNNKENINSLFIDKKEFVDKENNNDDNFYKYIKLKIINNKNKIYNTCPKKIIYRKKYDIIYKKFAKNKKLSVYSIGKEYTKKICFEDSTDNVIYRFNLYNDRIVYNDSDITEDIDELAFDEDVVSKAEVVKNCNKLCLKDIKEALDKYKKEGIGCLNNINI
jgi:hypothetical protein